MVSPGKRNSAGVFYVRNNAREKVINTIADKSLLIYIMKRL